MKRERGEISGRGGVGEEKDRRGREGDLDTDKSTEIEKYTERRIYHTKKETDIKSIRQTNRLTKRASYEKHKAEKRT